MSHTFLFQILTHIKLPKPLLKWIKILLTDIKSTIELNGTLSDSIPLNKGVRQGCPLSMLLFIIVTDILSQKINQAKNIHGIKLLSNTIKIQQYADDTSIILTDEDDITELANILNNFSAQSGLALDIKNHV